LEVNDMKSMKIKAAELDRKFDEDVDVSDLVDWPPTRRPNIEIKRVNVNFPAWVVAELDQRAKRLGVTKQALIKLWIAERLQ
jgi:hypothetical protein